MGVGTNIQDKLVALHDLDCPWRPSDLEQRAGRILRQGNQNEKVQIYRYISTGTFDSYLYQTIELKQKFISQIMTSKNPVRSCEDADESVLSYAEIKALAAGSPKIKEKMELDVQVAKLRMAKTSHQNSQYGLQDKLRKELPVKKTTIENRLTKLHSDIELRNVNSPDSAQTPKSDKKGSKDEKEKFTMTINGTVYDKRDEAGKELMALTNVYHDLEPIKIGSYRGFDMTLEFDPHSDLHRLTLKGNDRYKIDMGDSALGNITRLNNVLNGLEDRITKTEEELQDCGNQERLAREQLEKPFAQEEELAEKSARLAKLNLELNIDNHSSVDDEEELTLSQDEEYDYRNELAETGIDEAELFSRRKDDPEETVAGVGEELTEQGKNDDLRGEIESGAMLDIDGTRTSEISQKFDRLKEADNITKPEFADNLIARADPSRDKMDLSDYRNFHYPKAAQFIDLHDSKGQNINLLTDGSANTYHFLVEAALNTILQEQKIADQPIDSRSANDEYHFIREYAMTKVCKELELPDFPVPESVKGLSDIGMAMLKERGKKLAEHSLIATKNSPEKAKEQESRPEIEIGQRVVFYPYGGDESLKLVGSVVSIEEKTITLQAGRKRIPVYRDKGVFEPVREPVITNINIDGRASNGFER
jgi:hypothetical protein